MAKTQKLDKRRWNVYRETCFMNQVGTDRRACGNLNLYEVRWFRGSWWVRAADSNGHFYSPGPATQVSGAEGEAAHQQACDRRGGHHG